MGFNNGYDSGYTDALEDVRNGKVAGLGPASENSGAQPTAVPSYMTNTDDFRHVDIDPDIVRASYKAPSSVTASFGDGALDFQAPAVPAGTVMNLSMYYETYNSDGDYWDSSTDLTSLGLDGTVTVNGNAIPGLGTPSGYSYGYATLVLWFDGTSWVAVTCEEALP